MAVKKQKLPNSQELISPPNRQLNDLFLILFSNKIQIAN